MSADSENRFPLGRMASLVVILALTVFPVVSCGPLEFQGHELLRNATPDTDTMDEMVSAGMPDFESMKGVSVTRTPRARQRTELFEGSEAWMHWLYVAVFLFALATLILPARARLKGWLAAAGAGGLLLFLSRFDTAVAKGAELPGGMSLFEWESGAYVALVGFGYLVFEALRGPPAPARSRYVTVMLAEDARAAEAEPAQPSREREREPMHPGS